MQKFCKKEDDIECKNCEIKYTSESQTNTLMLSFRQKQKKI